MTTLTRKHFECIAAHLRERQPDHPSMKLGYHQAITAVANALEELNPRFNRALFVECCTEGGHVPVVREQLELTP